MTADDMAVDAVTVLTGTSIDLTGAVSDIMGQMAEDGAVDPTPYVSVEGAAFYGVSRATLVDAVLAATGADDEARCPLCGVTGTDAEVDAHSIYHDDETGAGRSESWDGVACDDCVLIIVNDDDSGISDPTAHRAAMAALATPGEVLVIGDLVADFSTLPCDACGSTLAGERHFVSGWTL